MRLFGFKTLRIEYINGKPLIKSVIKPGVWHRGRLDAVCHRGYLFDQRTAYPREGCTDPPSYIHKECGVWASAPWADVALRYFHGDNYFMAVIQAIGKTIEFKSDDVRISGWRTKRAEVVAFVEPDLEWYNEAVIMYPTNDTILTAALDRHYEELTKEFDFPVIDFATAEIMVGSYWEQWQNG